MSFDRARAWTVGNCKECGEDIWPADEILVVREIVTNGAGRYLRREIYCKDCGELWIESQEMGQHDEPAS